MRNKTPKEIIGSIFRQYQKELLYELEKAETMLNIKRISDSGKVLEIALKNLLQRLLPDYVGITRGIIFCSDCNEHSNEIDLILYDKRYFSGFVVEDWYTESISYISIDTVLGIISVKKKLSLSSLQEAISNISSVYSLKRSDITNQFHYDLNFGDILSYKNGCEVNKIFSCIVAFENELFYKTENGKKKIRRDNEIEKYLDEKSSELWFDGMNTDIIYTIDGTVFSPMILDENKNKWIKIMSTDILGEEKKSLRPYIENDIIKADTRLMLGYSYDFESPEISLGQFIAYLNYYCYQLVKSTPNINKIFDNFINRTVKTMMTKRHINEL